MCTLRIDRDRQMFARLASETTVHQMFTPVAADKHEEMRNQMMKARPYRLLRVGTFYYQKTVIKFLFMSQNVKKNLV